jgi:hypothetical protein
MPRTCTVCAHGEAHAINVALVNSGGNRRIAARYGLSEAAIRRHRAEHIPQLLAKAAEAVEVADADDLLAEVRDLQARTLAILEATEETNEHRIALAAIREARGNLELLAKLLGELDERPVVNLTLSPAWLELRAVIVAALEPYSDARGAVLRALEGADNGRA